MIGNGILVFYKSWKIESLLSSQGGDECGTPRYRFGICTSGIATEMSDINPCVSMTIQRG